jgi:hypothetical protein
MYQQKVFQDFMLFFADSLLRQKWHILVCFGQCPVTYFTRLAVVEVAERNTRTEYRGTLHHLLHTGSFLLILRTKVALARRVGVWSIVFHR